MGDNNKKISFMDELQALLSTVKFGSIEIYIQDHVVTQVTVRNIKKTKVDIHKDAKVGKVGKSLSV